MYNILIIPLVAGALAQIIKFIIRSNQQKISWRYVFAYSGMPSGHSSIVVSLAVILGLEAGFDSPLFAVGAILALIVIRDALGIRRYLGQHGKMLNTLIKDLDEDHVLDREYPHLVEQIGHTPAQVVAGSLLGFIVSVLGYYLL